MNIILFDGVCHLCNGVVAFIARHDRMAQIYFASQQSDLGKSLLQRAGIAGKEQDTLVYLRDGHPHVRSSAVLYMFRDMGGGWRWLYGFIIIPRFIRDAVYRLISSVRYRIGGKQKVCPLLSPGVRARFL